MASHKLTLADVGATGTIKVPMPIHDKRLGWIVKERPVAVHGSESEARSIAAAILASWQAHHDAWLGRVTRHEHTSRSCSRCGRADFRKSGNGLAWHEARCAA
jgi:hypothetical protein